MKYLRFFWMLLPVFSLQGQTSGSLVAPTLIPLSEVETLEMPAQDNEALMAAELKSRRPGRAPHFAEVMAVDVKPTTHGTWEYLKDGRAVWRLRIHSPGAYSLNLGFTLYQMPKGGQLIMYDPGLQRIRGPFTPADNEEHAQLWTPILEGDELVLEIQLPKDKIPELGLHLSTVNHDFMGFARAASGSCNLDVVCGAADGYEFVDAYRDVIQSVAVYGLRGSLFCTGFLVNNTRQDCTPFFMTAAHCGVTEREAASLVVYWNFENSTCRELGSAANSARGDGQLNDFNTGAILRAGYNPSDMALLELDDPVSETAEAYFAGWTRETTPPQNGVVSVHHPNADEKSISYSTKATYLSTWPGPDKVPNGNHIVVPEWTVGTTELGSSGGPLFNEQGLVVGQLHGGVADCASSGYDLFGWFATSWEGAGTPSSSLRRWLDPDNTGTMSLPGRSQRRCSFFVEASIPSQSVCAPAEGTYTLQVSEAFAASVNLQVTGLPEGLTATFSLNPVAPGGSAELRIKGTNLLNGGDYSFTVIGTDGTESTATQLELTIFSEPPGVVNLLEPADGATELGIRANFSWANEPFTNRYAFELATDPDFQQISVRIMDLASAELENFALAAMTTYYWRVQAQNLCGWGEWSEVRSFTTAGIGCAQVAALAVPVTISGQVNTITSTINITAPGRIQDLRLTGLDITHTFVGDLRVSLISPMGTELVLFDRPGLPRSFFGCDGDDLRLNFSDEASNTAADLESTCNRQPAIQGSFQPLEAFANLKEEPITGTWTLKVADLVPEDGGRLNAWGLEFCTSLPDSTQIFALTDTYQGCVGEPLVIQLLLGTGFPGPVEIETAGLPSEASVTYSKSPAEPGATVDVIIDGLTDGGDYDLVFNADTARAGVHLSLTDLPPAVLPLHPADSSHLYRDQAPLQWSASSGAEYYELVVYENVITGQPFLSVAVTDTVYLLENLDFQTTYYWKVIPHGSCGGRQPDSFQTFFTLPDLALNLDPLTLKLCQTETGGLSVGVGPGFNNPARISYRLDPPDTLSLRYDVDPNALMPGSIVQVALEDLRRMAPGTYILTFLVEDGVFADSVSLNLTVEGSPGLPRLQEPAANAELMDPIPVFRWLEAPQAVSYRLEIAMDAGFSEVLVRREANLLSLRLMEALDPGDYYWRITALNRCGGATSSAMRFTIQSTGTTDWAGASLRWYPNPTNGKVFLDFGRTQAYDIQYELYGARGTLLARGLLTRGRNRQEIDLHTLPAGIYLMRLQQPGAAAVLRIIKQ